MALSDAVNILILLATILPFLYSLHVANRQRGQRIEQSLSDLTALTRKHDKRSKQLRRAFDEHLRTYHNRPTPSPTEPTS